MKLVTSTGFNKMRGHSSLWLLMLFILAMFSACTMEHRVYRPGYHVSWFSKSDGGNQKHTEQAEKVCEESEVTPVETVSEVKKTVPLTAESMPHLDAFGKELSKADKEIVSNEIVMTERSFNKACDTIYFTNGSKVPALISLVDPQGVKYHRCDYLEGPVFIASKSDISKIVYGNGTVDNFFEKAIETNQPPKKEEMAMPFIALVMAIVGLILVFHSFIVALLLLMLAAVLSGISLSKMKKNPGKYAGKGFAIAALILSSLSLLALFVLLSGIF